MSKSLIILTFIAAPVVFSVWTIIVPVSAAVAVSGIIYYLLIEEEEVPLRKRSPASLAGDKLCCELGVLTEIKKRVLAELKDVTLITIKEKAQEKAQEEAKSLILIQEIERARPAKEAAERASAVEKAGPGATEAKINAYLMVIRAHKKAEDSEKAIIRSKQSADDAMRVVDRTWDDYNALSAELLKKYPPTINIDIVEESWGHTYGGDCPWGPFFEPTQDYVHYLQELEGARHIGKHACDVNEDAAYAQLRAQEALAADIQALIEAKTVLAREISKTALVVESILPPIIEDAEPKVVQVGLFIGLTWVELGGTLAIAAAVLAVAWRLRE